MRKKEAGQSRDGGSETKEEPNRPTAPVSAFSQLLQSAIKLDVVVAEPNLSLGHQAVS